jgi:cyclohexanecarboxylate-CoA ligase
MPAPLAHVSGLLNGVLVPGAAGMKTVLMDRWDPEDALRLVESERITFMVGPPTFFLSMASAPSFNRGRAASLHLISSGGTGVTPEFVRDATQRFGATVKRTYGSTEAPTITTSQISDPPDRAAETDGQPTPGTEVKVVNGEVWVRGPEVCVGYLDPATTRGAFTPDGWFRTGDRGTLDDEGWLTLAGRRHDLIIRGGENVSATEVEALLESHPGIRQAVVVGVPDERLGERVAAVIVAGEELDVADVQTWFTAQGAARYKTPEIVVRVAQLPSLASGKPDRQAVATLARAAK